VRSMSVTSSTSETGTDRVTSPMSNHAAPPPAPSPMVPTVQTPVSAAPKKKQGVKRKQADTTTPPAAPYDSDQVGQERCHDTQHNVTQLISKNDTRHIRTCHSVECRYAECRVTFYAE
jgi:hypothetical protein